MPFVDDPRKLTSGRFGKPIRDARWSAPSSLRASSSASSRRQESCARPSFKGLNGEKSPKECRFEDLHAPELP